MNRAERRRNGRAKKVSTLNVRKEDIDRIKQEATEDAIRKAFVLMLNLPLIVLRDKHGFGKKRLERFSQYVLDQFEAVQDRLVAFNEIKEVLEKETGMKIKE